MSATGRSRWANYGSPLCAGATASLSPDGRPCINSPSGRVYLDVEWDVGLVVEIDGGHHAAALNPLDDALRQNEVTLSDRMVLRIPVIALRLDERAFMEQVARAYRMLSARRAA